MYSNNNSNDINNYSNNNSEYKGNYNHKALMNVSTHIGSMLSPSRKVLPDSSKQIIVNILQCKQIICNQVCKYILYIYDIFMILCIIMMFFFVHIILFVLL